MSDRNHWSISNLDKPGRKIHLYAPDRDLSICDYEGAFDVTRTSVPRGIHSITIDRKRICKHCLKWMDNTIDALTILRYHTTAPPMRPITEPGRTLSTEMSAILGGYKR